MKNKYPFTKQEGIKDCASASLSMIIKYYGGYVSLGDLNEMMHVSKNGTTAYNLIQAANKIGFESKGVKVKLEDINENNIILPVISHVIINKTYNHFIVIYKINFKKKYLVVGDPMSGIKKISFSTFKEIYDDILIFLYPIKPIMKNREITFKEVFINVLSKYKKEITHLGIISLIYVIFSLISSFYLKVMFDNINTSINFLTIILTFFLMINMIKVFSDYFRNKLLLFINKKIDANINISCYKKIINLPYRYFESRTTGEVISKLIDLDKIREAINKVFIIYFMDLPLSIIALILLLIINKKLFLISLLFLILYYLVIYLSKRILKEKIDDYYYKKEEMISYMQESISGYETIKGINIEDKVARKYENKYIKYLNNVIKLNDVMNTQNFFKEMISNLSELFIIYIGLYLNSKNLISIGTLLMFNAIQYFFLSPIKNIVELDSNLIEAKRVIKKVYEMITDCYPKKNIYEIDGDINVKNLEFSYSDKLVIKNSNIMIKKGEKILFTGDSGSGKSTLFKILMGYLNVERDKIYINNHDINDIDNLRENISYISQNETLFTDTLYNNISIYDSDIKEVTDMCFIKDIIKNNNLGYNMMIEENGSNLSGGQKQRIVLARTLLKKFNILLIDEGLNEMEIELERKILKNIFSKYKDKTIIVISHRIENIDLYDRHIKLKEGMIYE